MSAISLNRYDSVHEEDNVGLQSVKKHFWDRGRPDVEVYLRRQTVEGDWIWLASKVVSFIDNPVPGVILHECRVENVELAETVSRTTRIAAMLTEAVLDSRRDELSGAESMSDGPDGAPEVPAIAIPGVADDAAALQSLLENAAGEWGIDLSGSSNPLQQLMNAAASGGAMPSAGNVSNVMNSKKKRLDPLSVLDILRAGACIDMSKISLTTVEVKLLTLVLTGRMQIEDLPKLVLTAMNSPSRSLVSGLEGYPTDFDLQQSRAAAERHGHTSRKRTSRSLSSQSPRHLKTESLPAALATATRPKHPRHQSAHFTDGSFPNLRRDDKMMLEFKSLRPPNISVVNLSFSNVGSSGVELLCEILYSNTVGLKTLDLSFCSLRETGIIALCRAFRKRKKFGLPSLQGLLLSGNYISYRAAKELGQALSLSPEKKIGKRRQVRREMTGYDEDDEEFDDEEDDEGDDDILFGGGGGRRIVENSDKSETGTKQAVHLERHYRADDVGLQLLHLGCSSITPESLHQILLGLGQDCPIRELSIPSNRIGSSGATLLVAFLEGKGILKYKRGRSVMPNLDRLDLSDNDLGNDGTAKLTRAISKRVNVNIFDLRLSTNNIGAGGIETIMNKLLQHNLVSLSLDNNTIGDRGCQLVAASLPSMHHLSRLNLSFNQIGSRGITTLMRALIGSESITYLGLSGNVLKISGAIATGFALAQHPRLAELELDNCCLSQVAQCHIVAGVISNRWVPMKRLNGFRVGPPMVAIGALEVLAQHLSNEECFRIRRDIQMKTILQWMESNRAAKMAAEANQSSDTQMECEEAGGDNFLTADFVSDVRGAASQSAYLMLDWLSRIPFDEDELNDLRRYFYDGDGGEGDGMRGSDGNINLKHRGDLLAALGSEIADEIRDADPIFEFEGASFVGLFLEPEENIDDDDVDRDWVWGSAFNPDRALLESGSRRKRAKEARDNKPRPEPDAPTPAPHSAGIVASLAANQDSTMQNSSTMSSLSRQSMMSGGSARSTNSQGERTGSNNALKARITMFPQFAAKLDMLKASAQEMMDREEDPNQQDIIAQQFAEASLTLMRQLRYHCMNQGLDGWRQGKIRRKVLIVDDSMVTRKMVARAFEKANFIVDTAENGMEGVAKLKESIYDIAFMDIDMPVMNGFDATKALREWEDRKRPGARQPICALTAAYVDDFEREELMKFKEAGLDVMESKPCNIPRLFKVVDDVSPMFSDLSISVTQTQTQSVYS